MILGKRALHPRCLLVWLAANGGLALCWRVLRPFLVHGRVTLQGGALAAAPLDRVLADLAALVLAGCAAWLWLLTTLVVVEAVRGARLPVAAPDWVRRPVLAACGIALVGGLSQPALAVPTQVHLADPGSLRTANAHVLDGLPLPDRAVGGVPCRHGGAHPSTPRERPLSTRATVVVVAPGDTLWDIADRLSPGASTRQIAHRWQAVYAANRAVIGEDPDLIEPGQHLVVHGRHAS